MASVRKRGNSYQVVICNGYDIDGKKITETDTYTPLPGMKDKEIESELRNFITDFERAVKAGVNVKANRLKFVELADMFLEDMKPPELGRTTYKDYKRRLELRIIPALGHMKIGAMNNKTIKNYCNMLAENYERKGRRSGGSLSDGSVKKDCALISSILSYAVWEGYLQINPLIYSGKKRRKKNKKEYKVKYFTMEQLLHFVDALEADMEVIRKERTCARKTGTVYTVPECRQPYKVSTKWKLFFYLMMFCGDRRGENISLKWNELDFKTGVVTIDSATTYVDGVAMEEDTKGDNFRDNTIPPYVVEIAKRHKADEQKKCIALGENWKGYKGKDFDKNFIFTKDNGGQMHIGSPYNQYKHIIKVYNGCIPGAEEDKIPEDVTMHGLRHSTAAILISNNLDPRTVAQLLGHSDPTTTLNIYSYFFKNKGTEAAKIMENVLFPEKTGSQTVAK